MTRRPTPSQAATKAELTGGRTRDPTNARLSFIASLVAIATFLIFAVVVAIAALLAGP